MGKGANKSQTLPVLEVNKQAGAIRYLEHGVPHWRVRWHYHEEYELHLIVASTGKMFIGDYIGNFQPGCLVLTAPYVPHNWLTANTGQTHFELRDHIVHFDHAAITAAAEALPELRMLLPLLESARQGVEFSGHADIAKQYMLRIRESNGAARLAHFCELLDSLARSPHQKLLSTARIELAPNDELSQKVDQITRFIFDRYQQNITLPQTADFAGMSERQFSRFIRKATGNSFTDFVNRIRIAKACELLSDTEATITLICSEVGFNNIANFNRRFQKYKHMTPRDYRRQSRQRYT